MSNGSRSLGGLPYRHWQMAILLLCAVMYLYLILFVPWITPLDTSFGDDNRFLYEGIRIFQGQVIYRDFFEFNFAGTQYFYALLIRLFGIRAWIPNVCLLGLGVALFCTSIAISRQLMRGPLALLPGLLFLCLAFRNYLDATHHWYSILLIMVATAVLATRRSNACLILAGALCGLALCFSQNHGPLAAVGFAIFVFWEGRADGASSARLAQRGLYLLLPVAVALAAYVTYFAFTAGLQQLLFCTLIFPVKYWGHSGSTRWSDYIATNIDHRISLRHFRLIWRACLIAVLIPGVYMLSTGRYLLRRAAAPANEWKVVVLLSAIGASLFASVASSASTERLSAVSLPGFILLIWLCNCSGRAARALNALLWISVCLLMATDIGRAQTGWLVRFDTPSGPIALRDPVTVRYYQWLAQNTRPGEYVFDGAGTGIYFRFQLQNPTELAVVTDGEFTRPEQVADAVRDLERYKASLVLVSGSLGTRSGPFGTDHLFQLKKYLRSNYGEVASFPGSNFGTISILERRNASELDGSASHNPRSGL